MAIPENPSAENFPSPGLVEQPQPLPYAASPTRWLPNHGSLSWNPVTEMGTAVNVAALTKSKMSVASHPQRDDDHSVNTEYNGEDEWINMLIDGEAGNFDLSFLNYEEHSEIQQLQKGEESNDDDHGSLHIEDYILDDVLDVPTQSPGRMVVNSNSSDDSLGSFDPCRLWGDNEYRYAAQKLQNWQTFKPCSRCFISLNPCKPRQLCVPAFLFHLEWLCQNMVVEVGKGEEIMRINVRKAYLEVDFASEENYPVCVSEPEFCWGEMTERNLVSRRYMFCSKTHRWNVISELLGAVVRVLLYLGIKNYTFGISAKGDRYTKIQKLVCLGRTFLNYVQMPHLHILQRLILCHLERCALKGVARLLSRKEIKVRIFTAPSRMNHTTLGMLPGLESGCRGRLMQHTPSYQCPIPAINDAIAISNRSKEKGTTRGKQQKDSGGITVEDILKLLHMKRDDAAKTLNVSTSTFKRVCRRCGIRNWRDEKRAKNHEGSQQCPLPPKQVGTATFQGNNAMSVKVTYKKNTVRFALSSSSTMKDLEEQLETRFKITLDNFFINYQDEEGEWITLMCDPDLRYCMDLLSSSGKSGIRMMVIPKSD
nr:protein NLP7-like [Ipomoea batatas]